MNYIYSLFLLILITMSCSQQTKLEKALIAAGENRNELEVVLKHYENDSTKLKAAVYLIENMPYHYSYEPSELIFAESFYDEIDSTYALSNEIIGPIRDSIYSNIVYKHLRTPKVVSDIKVVSSDFLIRNIDRSFNTWKDNEWARHINFSQFCEYILPYKSTELQYLDDWKEYLAGYCRGDLDELRHCDLYRYSSYKACETVNSALKKKINPRLIIKHQNVVKRMSTLTKIPYGTCADYNILAVSTMRAKGIPCAIDFTPQWPFRSFGHSWGVVLKESGKHAVFEGVFGAPGIPHKEEYKMAKVFRETYEVEENQRAIIEHDKNIPDLFKIPFKDVTEEYLVTKDLKIESPLLRDYKYAYIAVFNNRDWTPIYWGEVIKKKKVTFDRMGKSIVYLPVVYKENKIVPFADPILLTAQGEERLLKADTTKREKLILNRKYPPLEPIYAASKRTIGAKFQASNDPLFLDATTITLHTVIERAISGKEVLVDSSKPKFRYWRYYSPKGGHCNIAELYFFYKDSLQNILGEVIGTDGSWGDNSQRTKHAAFDNDALTYFSSKYPHDTWVGMDFGKPVNIDKIQYLPRNDGNCIEKGDTYELMYWGNNSWRSLDKKVANGVVLTYENCPANALFLLRNLTKGKEERIFTYENGKQIWW